LPLPRLSSPVVASPKQISVLLHKVSLDPGLSAEEQPGRLHHKKPLKYKKHDEIFK